MIIYCEKCGAPYNEFFFCEQCGHILGEEEIKAHNNEKKRFKSETARDAAYDRIVGADKPHAQRKSDNKMLLIILSVFLLVLVILAVYLFQR